MSLLNALLSSIYLAAGYVSMLPKRMNRISYILLYSYIFSLYFLLDTYLGQWLMFPMTLGCSIIIYWGNEKRMLDLIFALAGYFVLIMLNHMLTVLLSVLGYYISDMQETVPILMYLVLIVATYIILRFIRRHFILSKLSILYACPKKLLRFFLAELYIGLGLMAANFIYGEFLSYPTEILSFNGLLITIFVLSTILIFYSMYDILKKNHELSLQQAQAAIMQDYAHRMESLYEDIRSFRHDYRNILATMQQYIDNGNIEELQEYYYKTILNSAPVLSDDGFYLGRLHQLQDNAVKSLLYTKIVAVLNHDLKFHLEIAEQVPVLPVDSLALCRVLGILMDNAMEAAMDSPAKELHISIVSTDAAVFFVITNSTLPLSVPVSSLVQQGYSTKEGHEGIGLVTVAEVLDAIPYADLSTKYEDGVFCQTLKIQEKLLDRKTRTK